MGVGRVPDVVLGGNGGVQGTVMAENSPQYRRRGQCRAGLPSSTDVGLGQTC